MYSIAKIPRDILDTKRTPTYNTETHTHSNAYAPQHTALYCLNCFAVCFHALAKKICQNVKKRLYECIAIINININKLCMHCIYVIRNTYTHTVMPYLRSLLYCLRQIRMCVLRLYVIYIIYILCKYVQFICEWHGAIYI